MAFSENEKTKLITGLQKTHQQGQRLEVILRMQDNRDDADRVWRSNDTLYRQIDYLITEAIEAWEGDAKQVMTDLGEASDGLTQAIKDIRKSVDTAKNIIRAVGYLDDAVKIAAKVLKAIG